MDGAFGARPGCRGDGVADASAVERAADDVERTRGPIRVTEVTYLGYVHGTRAAPVP
jgi:hypothetical protein